MISLNAGLIIGRMKVMIEISRRHYDALLGRIGEESPMYSTLKNGVTTQGPDAGVTSEMMAIFCDGQQAHMLLRLAKQLSPESAYEVAKGLRLVLPKWK
jgi:hypothetical protein